MLYCRLSTGLILELLTRCSRFMIIQTTKHPRKWPRVHSPKPLTNGHSRVSDYVMFSNSTARGELRGTRPHSESISGTLLVHFVKDLMMQAGDIWPCLRYAGWNNCVTWNPRRYTVKYLHELQVAKKPNRANLIQAGPEERSEGSPGCV